MSNAEEYLRKEIPTMVGEAHVSSMKLTTMIALLNGYHESKVKATLTDMKLMKEFLLALRFAQDERIRIEAQKMLDVYFS